MKAKESLFCFVVSAITVCFLHAYEAWWPIVAFNAFAASFNLAVFIGANR